MCTATWIHRPEGGFELFFNRDERLSRGAEAPAAPHGGSRGAAYLAPLDTDFGGTWIGVNESGLACALLNAEGSYGKRRESDFESRGHLVRALLTEPSIAAIEAALSPAALTPYRGFRLLVLAPAAGDASSALAAGFLYEWDGRAAQRRPLDAAPMPLASSPLGIETASAARARRLADLQFAARGAGPTPGQPTSALLERFHRDHAGPPELAVCLHAAEAGTKSHVHIRVEGERAQLTHTPGPPCSTRPAPALHMDLSTPR